MVGKMIDGVGMTSARTRVRLAETLKKEGITNKAVLSVIAEVPRHLFVDEALAHRAYDNVSLPIGQGQTISSPYIVAKMTSLLLEVPAHNKVLEVGTGCGYQTMVLSRLFKTVHSIERINALLAQTRLRLRNLNVHNVRLKHGDGMLGWEDAAPFDAIIMTAAATTLPETLANQLAVGGKLVLPYGKNQQELRIIGRTATGFTDTWLEKVNFVPILPGTC
jgi:protein-L-isoaspartate(D-aspartate) O-methyltransferase